MRAILTSISLCISLIAAFAAEPALAGSGALGAKTMREPLPKHEVERGLLLNKGWLELSLGYDLHRGVGAWSDSDGLFGEAVDFDHAKWTYTTYSAEVRYGLGPRIELWWRVPFHTARLQNDLLGTDTRDASIGDPRFGTQILLAGGPTANEGQLALDLQYKGPAGKEAPGTFIGGPNNVGGFVFTTGTPDARIGLGGKKRFGPIALVGHAAYVHRFSAVVQYLVELENLQFLGKIKPGDQILVDAGVQVQAGPLVIEAGADFEHRGQTLLGANTLKPLAGSDGNALDAQFGLVFQPSRGVDIDLNYTLPLGGQDLQFFPIEDLQPTYGPTIGGALEVRY